MLNLVSSCSTLLERAQTTSYIVSTTATDYHVDAYYILVMLWVIYIDVDFLHCQMYIKRGKQKYPGCT